MTFDGQILATVELALDDDRLADVHDVPLHVVARFGTGSVGLHGWRWCGRGRRSRRLTAWPNCFITFPHLLILRLTAAFVRSHYLNVPGWDAGCSGGFVRIDIGALGSAV